MNTGAVSLKPESHVLPAIFKLVLASNGNLRVAAEAAPYAGVGARVVEVLKSLAEVGTTSAWDEVAAFRNVTNAFVASLTNSAFFRLAESFFPLPLRTRVVVATTTGTGNSVNEGEVKPISQLSLGAVQVDAVKALGIVIASQDLAKLGGELAERLFRTELRNLVSGATDAKFFALLQAGGSASIASAGSTIDALSADIQAAFAALDTDAGSRLFWVGSSAVAKRLSAMIDGGSFVSPDLSPTGGMFVNLPFVVSDGVTSDSLWLVDSAQIGGSFETLKFSTAAHANVQLETSPDSPVVTSTIAINLWQQNLIGLKCEVFFGAKPLRSSGFAVEITGAGYGNSP